MIRHLLQLLRSKFAPFFPLRISNKTLLKEFLVKQLELVELVKQLKDKVTVIGVKVDVLKGTAGEADPSLVEAFNSLSAEVDAVDAK